MRKGYVGMLFGALGLFSAACGGDEASPPPAAPPPPPPVAAMPPSPTPASTTAMPTPAKPSPAEMMAATAKVAADAINAHDAKKFAATFAEDGVWNMVGAQELKGRADIEKQVQTWFDAFKNVKFAFTRAWAKGEMAVFEWGWTGTHTGEFMGMKPTEKPAGLMGVSVVWMNPDGTVKRNNHYTDMVTLMNQTSGKKARAVPTLPANMESWTAKGTPEEDKNVETWKTMFGALEGKKEADFLAAVNDDVEWNDMTQPDSQKGKAEAKKAYGMLTKAIPDMKFTPTTTMGVGDVAIVEYTLTGTQKGALGPAIPAKNKPINVHGVHVFQVKDGKLAKGWDYANNMEMMVQLGIMKMPAPAAAKAGDKKTDAKGTDPKAGAGAGDKKTDAKPGATPATPAKPATPATGGAEKTPAKPATPATPAKPAEKK